MEQAQTEPTHKHPHLWMIATVVVVLLGVAGVVVYLQKIRNATPPTTQTQVSGTPKEQAKKISDELKQLDLAEIKASVAEIQSILAAL